MKPEIPPSLSAIMSQLNLLLMMNGRNLSSRSTVTVLFRRVLALLNGGKTKLKFIHASIQELIDVV